MNGFFVGLQRQIRIISALLIREVRLRNSKHAFSQLFDLLEALFFIVGHVIVFTFMRRQLLIGDSLLTFITTGIAPVLYFRTVSIRTASALRASTQLVNIPGIQPLDYAIARATIEVFSFIILFSAFLAGVYVLGYSNNAIPWNFGPVIISLSLLTVSAFGMGLTNSFIIHLFPPYKMIWSGIARVQIVWSAVFYIPDYSPPQMKHLLVYNPMMHFVALFRYGFYPTYPTQLISYEFMFYFAAAVLVLGMAFSRVYRDHAFA